MELQAYLFTFLAFIFTFPTALYASRPAAAAAAAGAGLSSGVSSVALAQEGSLAQEGGLAQLTQPAVGGKRHGAQLQEGVPAAKKQKAETRMYTVEFTVDRKELLDSLTQALIKNDVAYVQTILSSQSANNQLKDYLLDKAMHANTPEMAQVLANAGCLTFMNQAFIFACRNSRHCPELVQWYIDHGALINGDGLAGENPLSRYVQCFPASNTPGHPKVKILLQEGALLRAHGNNILHVMKNREQENKHKADLLEVRFQEIRLLLKQHSDYRHIGIYQDLAVCTTTQTTESPVQLPRPLQTLIAHYYLPENVIEEPTYEELEQEPTELEKMLADLKKRALL